MPLFSRGRLLKGSSPGIDAPRGGSLGEECAHIPAHLTSPAGKAPHVTGATNSEPESFPATQNFVSRGKLSHVPARRVCRRDHPCSNAGKNLSLGLSLLGSLASIALAQGRAHGRWETNSSRPRQPRYIRNLRPCVSEDQVAPPRGCVRPRRAAGPQGIYTSPEVIGYLICGAQANPSKVVTRRSLRRSVSAPTFLFPTMGCLPGLHALSLAALARSTLWAADGPCLVKLARFLQDHVHDCAVFRCANHRAVRPSTHSEARLQAIPSLFVGRNPCTSSSLNPRSSRHMRQLCIPRNNSEVQDVVADCQSLADHVRMHSRRPHDTAKPGIDFPRQETRFAGHSHHTGMLNATLPGWATILF